MPTDRHDAGRRALAERAARVSRIRRRIAATAVGGFALVWGLIAATGSMGSGTVTTATTQAGSSQATTADQSSSEWSSEGVSGQSQSLPSVTTTQS